MRIKLLNKKNFEDFTVYEDNAGYAFVDIHLDDEEKFYSSVFEYFFSEDKLLRYCENKKNIKFEPSRKAYTLLFRNLKNFIDDKNEKIDLPLLEKEIEDILCLEGIVSYKDGDMVARKDKIGKIGEYIFSCLLFDYFKFECVIPKIHLQTDYNMSVYGIDTVFYSEIDNMILFGESKLSISLKNGIALIKKSLEDYEKQISDEYELVLSNRIYGDKLNIFHDKYGDYTEICVDINEFIAEAHITQIGIPIFIAHGTDTDPDDIVKRMNKIPKKKMLGLDTKYYCISLPVIDKYKMIATFTRKIREREMIYSNARK